MVGEHRAGAGTVADNDGEHSRRKSRFRRQPGHIERTERGDFGGLDDNGIGRRQRGNGSPHEQIEWEVPREDEAARAVGRAMDARLDVFDGERRVILSLRRQVREVADAGDAKRNIEVFGGRDGFANVEALDLGEDGGLFFHAVGEPMEEDGTFDGG